MPWAAPVDVVDDGRIVRVQRETGTTSASCRLPSEVIKRVSPVAWQHINVYGRYQFDADFTPIDFARLREQLSSEEVSRLYANAGR